MVTLKLHLGHWEGEREKGKQRGENVGEVLTNSTIINKSVILRQLDSNADLHSAVS